MKSIFTFVVAFFSLLKPPMARADAADTAAALDGLSQLNYSRAGLFTLGDTVNPADLTAPLDRCIVYDPTKDVEKDVEGAIDSNIRITLIKSLEDFEREMKFSFSFHAAANVKYAEIASGKASFTNTGKYENFVKNQANSMILVVEAYADHGRDMIRNYPLAEKYQKLIDMRSYDLFQKQCGTHFIRGVTRVSRLRITFTFSGLQEQSKNIIATTFNSSAEAGVNVKAINATAQSEMTLNLSNTLNMAKRLEMSPFRLKLLAGPGLTLSRP